MNIKDLVCICEPHLIGNIYKAYGSDKKEYWYEILWEFKKGSGYWGDGNHEYDFDNPISIKRIKE